MKQTLYSALSALVCAALLFWGCSQSDDGPIPLYPDGVDVSGYGYVLSATLDSGSRFHLRGDTLALRLDSMWTLSDCFLSSIEIQDTVLDTIAVMRVRLALGVNGTTDCPAPFFRPDTVLHIPVPADWKNVREVYVVGNAVNELFPGDTSASAAVTVKDEILLRDGSFHPDTVSVYLDSAFSDPYNYPRRSPGDSGVVRVLDSLKETDYAYRFMAASCKQIHDSCKTAADTAWPSYWIASDTALVPLRLTCVQDTSVDSLTYCLSANWVNDSTHLSDSVYTHKDTTWYSTDYYFEKIPECASVNRGNFSSASNAGRYFTAYRELFSPASGETSCGPSALPGWVFVNLTSDKELLDSAAAETVLSTWKKASVGKTEEQDDEDGK